jgi:sigma-B regulation protein RsbU (phosphoserine phosphatase)
MESARAVGGDLYDVIELEGSRFGLVIGDVSDKGVPASIFMALVRSLVRSEVCWACSPSEVLQNVNRHLLGMNQAGLFVTVIYGVYDPATRHFFYARGGHEIPLLYAADGTPLHPTHDQGMILGVFPDPPLDVQDLEIPPGSTLVLYTDGAFDAVNAADERFGMQRLKAAVETVRGQSATQVRDHILQSIHAFHGGVPQADDITLLVVKTH